MKKIFCHFISFCAILILAWIVIPSPRALAAPFDPTGTCGADAIDSALGCIPFRSDGGAQFTTSLFTFLAGISGGIALVIMLVAVIQIMTGGDNAEQVKKGKELFTGAVTGLLFIIFSVALLRLIAGDIIQLPGF